MSTNVYQINRGNRHSNKQKFCFDDVIAHVHDSRPIDGWFHKNLEIHVSSSLSNKQKYLAFKQIKMFLF